jgi:hypothetical protein
MTADLCIVAAGSQVAAWAEEMDFTQSFGFSDDSRVSHHCLSYAAATVSLNGVRYRPVCATHLAAWREHEPALTVYITDYVIEEAFS